MGGWLAELAEVEAAIRRMHADLDFCLEGGESGRACIARFDAALARVVAANPGRTIAVGSHGGVLGHLLARHAPLEGDFWRRIRNPHIFVFDAHADEGFQLDGRAHPGWRARRPSDLTRLPHRG